MGDDTSTLFFVQQLLEKSTETQNIQPKQPLQSLTIGQLINDLSERKFNGQAEKIQEYCRLFLGQDILQQTTVSLNCYDFDDFIDELMLMLDNGIKRCLPDCQNRGYCHKDNFQNTFIAFLKVLNGIIYRRD